jgi:hypothetical protein
MFFPSPSGEFINGVSKFPIAIGYGVASIMRAKFEAHGVPGIRPRGVVVHLFGNNGNFCHEPERRREILKREGFPEAIVFFLPLHTVRVW